MEPFRLKSSCLLILPLKSQLLLQFLNQSSKFCQESELALEPERHNFLDKVMSIVRSVELQSHVRIRLCMLGTSCVLLPRKLDRMLSTEELSLLESQFIEQGLAAKITGIDFQD